MKRLGTAASEGSSWLLEVSTVALLECSPPVPRCSPLLLQPCSFHFTLLRSSPPVPQVLLSLYNAKDIKGTQLLLEPNDHPLLGSEASQRPASSKSALNVPEATWPTTRVPSLHLKEFSGALSAPCTYVADLAQWFIGSSPNLDLAQWVHREVLWKRAGVGEGHLQRHGLSTTTGC